MKDWITNFSAQMYVSMVPTLQIAVLVTLFVLLPMAVFRRTRGAAGTSIFVVSYIMGITAWFLGATLTFASFGWVGLIIGLLVFGIGVVPLGIIGGFFWLDGGTAIAASLLVLVVLTFVSRLGGVALGASAERVKEVA